MEGIGLGWRETVLFLADRPGEAKLETAAFADRIFGLALDKGELVLGIGATFAVFEPDPGESIVQRIEYHADDPARSSIQRLQMR